MPIGFKGFQKGHKSFLTKRQYKQIGLENRGKLKGHPQWNTGRTHFRKGISNNAGSNNPMWKGGKTFNSEGYVLIKKRNHPNANRNGYILEHRFIVSEYIGRYLMKWEVVHHKNWIKHDNRIENLELFRNGDHTFFHCSNKIK